MKNLLWDELEKELSNLPMTWVPAVLRIVVRRAMQLNVFREGGLVQYVLNTIEEEK